MYDPIKIKEEAFSFDLRPVLSFRTMRVSFLKKEALYKIQQSACYIFRQKSKHFVFE